jgi:hypothetical protein
VAELEEEKKAFSKGIESFSSVLCTNTSQNKIKELLLGHPDKSLDLVFWVQPGLSEERGSLNLSDAECSHAIITRMKIPW